VLQDCLEYSIKYSEVDTVRGGKTSEEIRKIRAERGISNAQMRQKLQKPQSPELSA